MTEHNWIYAQGTKVSLKVDDRQTRTSIFAQIRLVFIVHCRTFENLFGAKEFIQCFAFFDNGSGK